MTNPGEAEPVEVRSDRNFRQGIQRTRGNPRAVSPVRRQRMKPVDKPEIQAAAASSGEVVS